MQNTKIATLCAGIQSFPTLPAIVSQVMGIIAKPESSAKDLMEVISPDQALTFKILKVANSAFYGRARAVATLDQALMVLGFEEIRNLVVSTAVFNNFQRIKTIPIISIHKFWEHSFLCGLAARIIAKETKAAGGELFVAGLVHDIGKLAICTVLPQEFQNVVAAAENNDLETFCAEQQILGITHAEIGMRIARRWMMPENLVAAIGYHHQPAMSESQTPYPIIIHLADRLSRRVGAMEVPADDCSIAPEIASLAQSHGISWHQEALNRFRKELETQKKKAAGILDIFLA
jgi:HD-like signal output (HDOD) protein